MVRSDLFGGLLAVVLAAVLIFGSGSVFAVQLADGTVVDYAVGDVEVGDDIAGVPATVDFVAGAVVAGAITVGNNGTVNMYGGVFDSAFGAAYEGWFEMSVAGGADVTFYGVSFAVGGDVIDEGTASVVVTDHPDGVWGYYNVAWTDADGNAYDIWVDADAAVNLSWLGDPEPDPEPEIDVDVAELSYDFGDIAIGEPKTFIIPIYNLGDGDLTVSAVSLGGSVDFVMTGSVELPLVIAPSELIGVDIEVTFTPSAEGLVSASLVIASDDADEGEVVVILTGNGIVVVVPPEQQIQDVLDFYDASVAEGTLVGFGPGNSASKRLKALRNMIKSAGDLINVGEYELAAKQLESVAKKTDGEKRPPDFVVGYSVETLNAMVDELIADLTL